MVSILLFLLVFFVIALFYLIATVLFLKISITVDKIPNVHTPQDIHLPYQDVILVTQDYYTLKSWFIENPHSKKTVILVHGFGTNREDLLPMAQWFYNNNYTILMFDLRGHGDNYSTYTTFGVSEKYDLQAAIDYVHSKKATPIIIYGQSMGAVTAILALADLPVQIVEKLILDSPFFSLEQMIRERLKNFIPYPLSIPSLYLGKILAKKIFSVDVDQSTPGQAIKNIKIPILLLHSKEDKTVTYHNAHLYHQLNLPNLILKDLEKTGHTNHHQRSYYNKTILNFIIGE